MREEFIEESCPCGSEIDFEKCCDQYISGDQLAPTAEALMRARYSAFVVSEPKFVYETHDPETREGVDLDEIEAWAEGSDWEGLNILRTEKGQESDDSGVVEFVAHYYAGKKDHAHHEVSEFTKRDGRWWFTDGKLINNTYRREVPKVGRNEPCPCGSGKKFKKCCA